MALKKTAGSSGADPDPLIGGTDPRIRIPTKMSRIRNTVLRYQGIKITPPETAFQQMS